MHLTPTNFIWVFVGLVLLVLFEIIKSKKKWGTSWAPGKYFTNNIPQFGIGIIGSYVMFYFAEQFTDGILDLHVHEDSNYYTWFALACGFNGHVIVEKLATVFKKNNPVKGSQSGYY